MSGIAQILATIGPKVVEYGKNAISSIMSKMGGEEEQGQAVKQPAPVSTPQSVKPVVQSQPAQQGQPAPQPAQQQSGGGKFYYPLSGYTGIAGVVKKIAEQGKQQIGGNIGNGGK